MLLRKLCLPPTWHLILGFLDTTVSIQESRPPRAFAAYYTGKEIRKAVVKNISKHKAVPGQALRFPRG
jgi:hypothetical protein